MPRSANQKLKLLVLLRFLQRQSMGLPCLREAHAAEA